jgi:uncharacterized protein
MTEAVLEAYVRNYLESHPAGGPVVFAWQGGEPALLGIDFYRKVLAFQRRYGRGREIENAFQTNGTLLDDDWCRFLAENRFLVGLSLDGPEEVHDAYRRTRGGEPTHARVMKTLRCLKRHRVEFNVLACVNRVSSERPLEVYRFLKESGVEFIQFIPVVERVPDARYRGMGLALNGPAGPRGETELTPWSVEPARYGEFMKVLFDEWVRHDVGRMFVMNFEWALASYMGLDSGVCHHRRVCGRSVVVEYNGDVYSCDHFVYPEYVLGNLTRSPLSELLDSSRQAAFGKAKFESLSAKCRNCSVIRLCWGGCPKHRFARTEDGQRGLDYLCQGYLAYFTHLVPALGMMKGLLERGEPVERVMEMLCGESSRKHAQ